LDSLNELIEQNNQKNIIKLNKWLVDIRTISNKIQKSWFA